MKHLKLGLLRFVVFIKKNYKPSFSKQLFQPRLQLYVVYGVRCLFVTGACCRLLRQSTVDNIHVVCSCLKGYLLNLDECLLTDSLRTAFIEAAGNSFIVAYIHHEP